MAHITETDPYEDAVECQRLELELLTIEQVRFLNTETQPRWDLDPPQREEYVHPKDYVLALKAYAERAMAD